MLRPFTRIALIAELFLLLFSTSHSALAHGRTEFPEPAVIKSQVAFWMKIYLDVGTNEGLLHDARYLDVVYQRIRFAEGTSPRQRQRRVDARKRYWGTVLKRLAGGGTPQSAHQRSLVELLSRELGHRPTRRDFLAAADRLRFQLGQKQKFRAGLIRSGRWEGRMRAIFHAMGLPEDLAYLPHVESSFNTHAYSKYGAAGMWQFMRSTGRRYLEVNYLVDERLDPLRATRAAAELLRDNYEQLGTWPLAITAYNHGRAGMQRAKQVMGTDDIGAIVEHYEGRTFGFASRNFYAQFLAARKIMHAWRKFFPGLRRDPPLRLQQVKLPFYLAFKDLVRESGLSRALLEKYNPALLPPALSSDKRIPAGYVLRLPPKTHGTSPARLLASIPARLRHAAQRPSVVHLVRRGDTLSGIAARYDTTVARLVGLNNLASAGRIYPGQVLHLPHSARRATARRVQTHRVVRRNIHHRVQRGETLDLIARHYDTSVHRLVALNDLKSKNRIYAGEVLRVGSRRVRVTPHVAAHSARISRSYRVRAGDTLSGIALRHDTSVARLLALNDLASDDRIYPGQVLHLKPPARSGHGGASAANAGSAHVVLASYRVRRGDSLGAIALAHGTTVSSLIARNKLRNADHIYAGQVLRVPARAGQGAAGSLQARAASGTTGSGSASGAAPPAAKPAWRRLHGKWTVVATNETLGHFADWLDVSTARLRALNHLRHHQPLRLYQRLRLDFAHVSPREFLQRRIAYHRQIREAFFNTHEVTGTIHHTVRKGESLWVLSKKVYSVPTWLIHRYNPDTPASDLTPGTRITIPVVEQVSSS